MFELLLCRSQPEGAAEFADDVASCEARCYLDSMARQHWNSHPSVTQLLSPPSLATVRVLALLATDNIAHIERQHATGRREAAMREQTHLERVRDASAMHSLGQLRSDSDPSLAFSQAASKPASGAGCGFPAGPSTSLAALPADSHTQRSSWRWPSAP